MKFKSKLAESFRPAVDLAVANYTHRTNPEYFHKRFQDGECPFCLSPLEEMRQKLTESLDVDDLRENIASMMEDE